LKIRSEWLVPCAGLHLRTDEHYLPYVITHDVGECASTQTQPVAWFIG